MMPNPLQSISQSNTGGSADQASTTLRLISGLWIGPTLPPLARLCIRSFQDHGFTFRLISYGRPYGTPLDTEVVDAREIIPENEIFTHSTGSLAPAADRFRYRYLAKHGGLWTDLDVVCLRPFEVPDGLLSGLEEPGLVNLAVIQFPPAHEVMVAIDRLTDDPSEIMPWDDSEEVHRKIQLRNRVQDVAKRRTEIPWGLGGGGRIHIGVEAFRCFRSCCAATHI